MKVNIASNQKDDEIVNLVKATVSYGSTSLQVSNGSVIAVPANTLIAITFDDVVGYRTPDEIEIVLNDEAREITGIYQTEILTVNVIMDSSVTMQTEGKEDLVLPITQDITTITESLLEADSGAVINCTVDGTTLTAGNWEGSCNVEISIPDDVSNP